MIRKSRLRQRDANVSLGKLFRQTQEIVDASEPVCSKQVKVYLIKDNDCQVDAVSVSDYEIESEAQVSHSPKLPASSQQVNKETKNKQSITGMIPQYTNNIECIPLSSPPECNYPILSSGSDKMIQPTEIGERLGWNINTHIMCMICRHYSRNIHGEEWIRTVCKHIAHERCALTNIAFKIPCPLCLLTNT